MKDWKTKIFKDLGEKDKDFQYGVKLVIGNQTFTLNYFGDKDDAEWMKDILAKAINKLINK